MSYESDIKETKIAKSASEAKLQGFFAEGELVKRYLGHHNMQISDYRYVDKVFENLRQKLRNSYGLNGKTNWGLFLDNDEVISSSRAPIPRELVCIQEFSTLRLSVAQSFEILNVSTMMVYFLFG